MPRPFTTPSEDALGPQDMRFLDLQVEPQPGGQRFKVRVELPPFLQDPSIELILFNSNNEEVSRVFIIETIDEKLIFTMHIKGAVLPGVHTLRARLYYEEQGTVDERSITFDSNAADN